MLYLLFGVAFLRLVLQAMNTRNIVQDRYVPTFIVSTFIGFLWLVSVVVVVKQLSAGIVLAECLGGASGAVVGMYLHKKIHR